ncbi:MAG: TonB-dependent receptor [Pseudomonadota bacterium]
MKTHKAWLLATTICAVDLLIAGAAFAQTAPDTAADAVEEVIVTGSRIARRDYAAESPIVTVGQDVLKSSGAVTVEASLNQLPQFTASAGAGTGGAGNANRGGQASANLRSLGPQRTLVLLDGRRMQPSNADGTVDLNTLPDMLIDNVEVITGGASAAYGSDAVAGVVNFKLKRNIDGMIVDAQYGVTGEGDGETLNLGVAIGSKFAEDRGGAMLAISFADRKPVYAPDRDFFKYSKVTTALPQGVLQVVATNLPTQAAVNGVFAGYGATTPVLRTNDIGFNVDGTLFSRGNPIANFTDPATHIYNDGRTLGYSTGDFGYLQMPLRRYSAFGSAHYEINEHVEAYGQALFTDYKATFGIAAPVLGGSSGPVAPIPVTNPFIPTDLATLLASRPNPTAPFYLTKRLDDVGLRQQTNQYTVYQLLGGLRGSLPDHDITWDVYGSYGSTQANVTDRGYPSLPGISTLLAAPDGGRSICEGGFNPFGTQALSAACQTYLERTITSVTDVKQTVLEGSAQGHLFEVPAGDVRFAVGADYRENTFDYQPDALAITGELVNFAPVRPTSGSTKVSEIYGEVLVPLLKDQPWVQSLELSAAYRYSHYNTVGGVHTYKTDLSWEVSDWVRLRGGYSRAVRAPNIGELYAALVQSAQSLGAVGPIGSGDPCDVRGGYRAPSAAGAAQVRALCLAQGVPTAVIDTYRDTNAQVTFNTSGNPKLEEEKADTFSIGAVLRSPFENPLFSNATLSIDYYNIDLKGAVGTVTAPVAVSKCYNADGSNPTYDPSNLYCGLVNRRPESGLIGVVQSPLLNLGGYKTAGVDVQADWSIHLADLGVFGDDPGTLKLGAVVSYLDTFQIQNLPNGRYQEYAGTILNTQIDPLSSARPRWKSTASVAYVRDSFDVQMRWRWIDAMTNAGNVGNTGTARGVGEVSYYDLVGQYTLKDGVQLRAGVINLTDKQAPQVGSVIGNTDYSTYDLVGRRFYVGARLRF